MIGSGLLGAQFIAGKAARDAFFLTQFDPSALPNMIIATSICSIVLVLIVSNAPTRVSPATWVPYAFAASAFLLIVEWVLATGSPGLAARLFFIQVSGLGPMLGSGFWLIASERFDPHTAKKRFGEIAGAGTLGGLLGGLAGEWVSTVWGIEALLPVLAAMNILCAWQIPQLANLPAGKLRPATRTPVAKETARAGLRALAETPYLRLLAALVFLGTVAALFIDQAFKTQVKAALGSGPALGTFFSRYYIAVTVVTFLVQTGASRFALERFGLGFAAGAPSLAFLAGGSASVVFPGLTTIVFTRWSEAVLRGSIYRAGYEVFFNPVLPADKRAAKTAIDVGVDRTADIVGATLVKQLLWMPQPGQTVALVSIAMGCSTVALAVANRLKRGYTLTLETRLMSRAFEMDLSDVGDSTTRTTMTRTLQLTRHGTRATGKPPDKPTRDFPVIPNPELFEHPTLQRILVLESEDRDAIAQLLRSEKGLSASLIPHVIPLLARDDLARDCIRALRRVAEEHVGQLLDVLLNPAEPFVVRRRLGRVFSVCVSQRAVDGLVLGLEDLRFEVRFQVGRSLLAIVEKNPRVTIDKARIFEFVKQEVAVNKEFWESRRLLDPPEEGERSFLDELVRDRASQSLAHVFTLLALALPTDPLRITFRGLHTDDQGLRGTALEYLEGVLPPDIRERLWPFLEDGRVSESLPKLRDQALADLLHSNQSIIANLEELKKRAASRRTAS
jgi:hypothetical protein